MASPLQKLTRTLAFTGLRAAFHVGELISPAVAARYAAKLWFSVPPAPPVAKRDRGVQPEETILIDCEGKPLPVHSWGQGPAVMLIHGWSGWWQQYSVYVEPLTRAGFRVLTWDAPSHGDSPVGRYGERRSAIPDFIDAFEAAVAHFGAPAGVVSHSGGAMAAAISIIDGVEVGKTIFIAPSVSPTALMELFRGRLGWGRKTLARMLRDVEERYQATFDDFEVIDRLDGLDRELPPALILHDEEDTEAPHEGADELAAAWPGATLVKTTGLGHHKVMWSPRSVNRIVEFLQQ